jgi:pimeloyl-ACP methyl ester carboxylesterase
MTIFRNMALAVAALLAFVAIGPAAARDARELVGNWHGTIATPQGEVVLVLHVKEDEKGAIKAQVENWYQAPGDLAEVTSISVEGDHLSWRVGRVGATYEGDWVAAESKWRGTFNQGMDLPLSLSKGLPPKLPVIVGLDGRWEGIAELNGARLRQVLRIATTDERGTVLLYDSPDQLAMGLVAADFVRNGQSVGFSLLNGFSKFAGTLSATQTQLAGTFTAPGQPTVPVTFARAQQTVQRQPGRPQTPRAPFPYRIEDVAFANPVQKDVRLAGTLTLPEGQGPFPAAVLISGSGGQDRDETMLGHKPFAVIADHLTRNGIAVLRYDDRGMGRSTGDYSKATSADLATDANAAAAYLMTRPEIRDDAIGFIGHSEGGMIGPIAMAGNDEIAFLVMLAGPGTALDKLLLSQRRLMGSQMGLSTEQLDRAEPVMAAMFRAIASADTPAAAREAVRALLTPEAVVALGAPAGTDPNLILQQVGGPWISFFLKYDPVPNLQSIKVPVLAIAGSLDRQVPSNENLPAIRAALSGNPDATIVELPGLNHLFQTARTGALGEYADIEETVAPKALDLMTEWLVTRFAKD